MELTNERHMPRNVTLSLCMKIWQGDSCIVHNGSFQLHSQGWKIHDKSNICEEQCGEIIPLGWKYGWEVGVCQ